MHPEIECLIKEREDLRPILNFYGLLLEKQESTRPDDLSPLIDISKNSIKDRLADGNPLIDPPKTVMLDLKNSIDLFFIILELIKDASDQFEHQAEEVRTRIERTDIEAAMKAVLSGSEEELRRLSERLALSEEMLFLLVGFSLAPSLRRLSSIVQDNFDISWWDEPFCPICGERPNMANLEEEGRRLYCTFCWMEWKYKGPGCLLCGIDDKKMVGLLRIRDEDGYHLSICGNCNGYVKLIDRRYLSKEMDRRIINIVSLPLEIIARQKGHKGPAVFPI
ncbi:MAG: formate dehydrogenase accessory protein FdhE [Nitrospirota bacterium]